MVLETQAVGPFFKNGFVVACEDTREGIIIDPGDEVDALLSFVRREGISIRYILLTHAHVDHITGVRAAKQALGVPICLHHDDLFLYDHVVEAGAMFGLRVEAQPPVDRFYTSDDVYVFGTLILVLLVKPTGLFGTAAREKV